MPTARVKRGFLLGGEDEVEGLQRIVIAGVRRGRALAQALVAVVIEDGALDLRPA
jgi:hypothetical protein